jgi:hypothetical protein
MWNRSYFHRAAPNRSAVRRRILKLSIQPAGLPNDRIGLDEFTNAMDYLDDQWHRAVIDHTRLGTTDRLPGISSVPQMRLMTSTATNDVTAVAIAKARARTTAKRLLVR